MRGKLLTIGFVFILLFVSPFGNSFALEKTNILAVSASPGGSWYAIMGAMGQMINKGEPNISIKVTPGGSFANILRVASNEAQMGFTFPFWITQALAHSGDYAKKPKLKENSLMTLAGGFGSSPLQFAVTAELAEKYGIETVKDLIEKKVPMKIAVNVPGTHEPWAMDKIFNFYGASLKDIQSWGSKIHYGGYTNAVQLMKDGHADVMIMDINPPAGPYVEVQLSRKLKFVPLTKDAIDYMVEKQGHAHAVIPAGTYKNQDADYPTATMLTILITNNELPEEVGYTIIKILAENKDKVQSISPALKVFNPETAWENLIAPLHPGAEKAYKELGFKK